MMKLMLMTVLLLFTLAGSAFGEYGTTVLVDSLSSGLQENNATYSVARDAESATTNQAIVDVGQYGLGGSTVFRSTLVFQDLPAMTACTACTLYVDGTTDASETDFAIHLYTAAEASPDKGNDDYSKFDGRQTGGAHTGTSISNTWSSVSYSAGWNTMVFNASGLDTLVAYSASDLWLMILSSEDAGNSEPSHVAEADGEYVQFTQSGAYLAYTYSNGWTGEIMGVTNPATVFGVDVEDIQSIMGVE